MAPPDKQRRRRPSVDDVDGGEGAASRRPRLIERCKARTRRLVRYALCIVLAGLVTVRTDGAIAEEPPWTVPKYVLPGGGDAIPFGGWVLYPTVRLFSVFSDNLYQSPVNPVKVAGIGIAPNLIAEWSNGIHRTTLYGSAEVRGYTEEAANIYDRQAGFVQRYEAMRDLMFTVQGDYTHRTNSSSLLNSLGDPLATPGAILLPDGNTQLPDGTIVTPGGQVVTPGNQTANVSVGSAIRSNPYDQFTGLASVYKIFNRGFVRLTGTASQTEYENPSLAYPNFNLKTFTGNGGFWFSPWLYAYSDGTVAVRSGVGLGSTVYRAAGGIGSSRIGFFDGAIYFGHQGSDVDNSGTAGGKVYGGRLSYYPTFYWTWRLTADVTENISNQTNLSNLALNTGPQSPILIPLGASTETTAINLQTDYAISRQLLVTGRVGYTRVEYLNVSRLDSAWLAYAAIKYQIWRNMFLTADYQYTNIISDFPLTSLTRNYATVGATYKF